MTVRSIWVVMLVSLSLAGCGATSAELQVQSAHSAMQTAVGQYRSCTEFAASNPAYSDIAEKLVLSHGNPTLSQMAATGLPTSTEVSEIEAWHNQTIPCRERILAAAQVGFAFAEQPLEQSFQQKDAALLGLVQQKLSWGDANQEIVAANQEGQQALNQTMGQWNAALSAQNQAEHAQRDAIWGAVGAGIAGAAVAASDTYVNAHTLHVCDSWGNCYYR